MLSRRDFLGTAMLAAGGLAMGRTAAEGFTVTENHPAEAQQPLPFRISLNVSTIRPYKLPVDQQIDVCGKAGFDGIELWMSDIQAYTDKGGSLADLAAKLKANRLVLENIIGFAPWAVDDQSKRDAGLAQMRREMEITAALGGKFIAAPLSGVDRLDSSRLDEYAQRFLRVIEAGKALGVTPLLELWGSGALYKLADAVYIAIATGHPDASLLLDFYHLYRGGNPFDSLNLINAAKLPVFHINDYPSEPSRERLKDSDRVYPGDGICPFETLIPMLYQGGFRGAFSVELFNEEYCRNNTVEQVLAVTLEKTRRIVFDKMNGLPQRGLCSHRGVNSTFPENTLPAFREAVRLNAQQIEFDVCRTKDGQLVIMHDATVDRTTNGTGAISELTFEQIRNLDAGIKKDAKFAGTKVPTFEEAIDMIPQNVWVNVHMKADETAAVMVAKIIVEKKRAHQAFIACNRSCADAVRKAFPQVMICNMERQGGDVSRYVRETIKQKCQFIQLTALCSPEEMQQLKSAGVKVNYFGVQSPEHCRQLIAAGVDFPLVDDLEAYLPIISIN